MKKILQILIVIITWIYVNWFVEAGIRIIYDTGVNISYYLNATENSSWEYFTWVWTITITDGDQAITILDRNLWAITNDITNIGSYWYHFQRGNNWGFKLCSSNWCSNFLSWDYGNTWYRNCNLYGPTNPLISNYFNYSWNYTWDDHCQPKNDNLWWWSGDINVNINDTGLLQIINATERQWPCPKDFHIPSVNELNALVDLYTQEYDKSNFYMDFKIPFAGDRDNYNAQVSYVGSNANIWSSSPNGAWARYLALNNRGNLGVADWPYNHRAYGFSVRCVKDSSEVNYTIEHHIQNVWDNLYSITWNSDIFTWIIYSQSQIVAKEYTGFHLSGDLSDYQTWVVSWLVIKLYYDRDVYTINFDTDGWNEIESITWKYESIVVAPDNPKKIGYTFSGRNSVFPVIMPLGWANLKAIWNKNQSSGWWFLRKDNCPNGDYSDSYYDWICWENPKDSSSQTPQNDEQTSQDDGWSNELQTAYEFAYENKITTMETIEKADMEWNLTRIAMAKMLSKYAINVLWKKPANKVVPKFIDITEELNAEYDYWVSLAYQLGIMWINMPENKFRPFDLVPRSEFVTALSRMKYNMSDWEYEWTVKFYKNHIELLSKLGIMTVADPDMKELRWYVMLMLMRSAK